MAKDLLTAELVNPLPDPVQPGDVEPRPLTMPQFDEDDRAEAAAPFLAPEQPPPTRQWLEEAMQSGSIPVKTLLLALPIEEARTMILAEGATKRFYPPDEQTLRYLLIELGEQMLPLIDRWASYSAPYLSAELGSQVACHTIVIQLGSDSPSKVRETLDWIEEHKEAAIPTLVQVAGSNESIGWSQTRVAARQWLADHPEAVLGPAIDAALAAAEPPSTERFAHGSPPRTLRWLARRFGVPRLLAARPEAPRARLEALIDQRWDQKLAFSTHKPKWWPVEPPRRIGGEPLDAEERRRLEALLEAGLHPEHPLMIELRQLLEPSSARQCVDALLDAFVRDKSKPMYRWTLVAALALSPTFAIQRLGQLVWTWSRSRNRNHRTLVPSVTEWLSVLDDDEAIAHLVMMAEGLTRPQHRQAAELALRHLALEKGVTLEELTESASIDLGLEPDGSLELAVPAATDPVALSEILLEIQRISSEQG